MAQNAFITPSWVLKDTLVGYKNELKLVGNFDRSYDDQYKQGGAKVGYTVNARIEQIMTVSEGQAFQQQAILNQIVPITINHQYHTDIGWSTADGSQVVEEVQRRYTMPAGKALANRWDLQGGAEVYKQVYLSTGTPGTLISDNDTWTEAVAKLEEAGVPQDFVAVISPRQKSKLLSSNMALFGPTAKVTQRWGGEFSGENFGISEWYSDPNVPMHVTGSFTASTPAIAGASQTGSTLAIDGMGTYAFKAGDTFTIAGVYMVNPLTKANSGILQDFSIQADVSGSSTATLTISPAIITSGSLQTVTGSPANDAAVSFRGATGTVGAQMTATSSKQNLVFHPKAFAFVMADLQSPLPGAVSKRISSKDMALSIRYAEQWNAQTDQLVTRLDTLGGIAFVLPYALRAYS